MKKILIAILGTFLLTSCIYTAMYHFSNSDLEWLSPYEQGDTILFRSETNAMDTLVVNEKYIKDTYWPFILAVLIAFAHRVQECEQSELRMEEMEIDGVFYSDACLCKGKDFSSPNDIKSEYFIWSKSKGLLQYKYLDGEVYTFYKKLPYRQSWWKRKIIDVFY